MKQGSYDIREGFASKPPLQALRSKALRRAGSVVLCGLCLSGFMLAVEFMLIPVRLQPMAQPFYRIAFCFALPFRFLLAPVVRDGGAVPNHLLFTTLTSFLAVGLFFAVYKILRHFTRSEARPERDGETIGRRVFLRRASSGISLACVAGIGAEGALLEPQRLAIRNYALPIRDLPTSLNGLRLVQISDTHYGPFVSLAYLNAVIAQVNALRPDLIALTGDYVLKSDRALEDGVVIFRNLESRLGTVAVLGNHDHWESAARCRQLFGEIGVPLVDNDRLYLSAAGFTSQLDNPESVCIAGVGDLWTDAVRPDLAFADVPPEMPRVLLSHNPDVAELPDLDPFRVDLMLSGHTHGGQVRLPIVGSPVVPSRYGQKYSGGLVLGPAGPVIVSRGVGMALFPVRLGVPPEIGVISLERA
jgi:predicted MPP superfamily phosphohydrolase